MSSVNIGLNIQQINFPNVLSSHFFLFCFVFQWPRLNLDLLAGASRFEIPSSVCRVESKKNISNFNDSLSLSKYSMGWLVGWLLLFTRWVKDLSPSFFSFSRYENCLLCSNVPFLRFFCFSSDSTQISTFFSSSSLLFFLLPLLLPSFLWLENYVSHIKSCCASFSSPPTLHVVDVRCLSTCFIAPSNSRLGCLLFWVCSRIWEIQNTTHSIQHS